MSRKNEIKKDIYAILREVYCIHEQREITDKQNEFLDKIVMYLDANLSLRRKGEKKTEEVEDNEPLLRPEPVKPPEPLAQSTTPILVSRKKGTSFKPNAPTKAEPKEVPKEKINASALPEHLRKYLKT